MMSRSFLSLFKPFCVIMVTFSALGLLYMPSVNKVKAIDEGYRRYPTATKWHDWFAPGNEIPLVGDFDCDGFKDDIVTFTNDANADVYVAWGNGSNSFGVASKYHDYFAPSGEIPLVGDFNNDNCDDIVTFTNDSNANVWVAINVLGNFGTASIWHTYFAPTGEIPAVGDFNGDGKDDIVTFTSDGRGDVWVALSSGSSFGTATTWHDYFAPGEEVPRVGDFNNDNYADIVTFTSDESADVWVALNTQSSSFGVSSKWHDYFAPNDEIPAVGDLDALNDADDIATFTSDAEGNVWIADSSGGTHFSSSVRANDYFAPFEEIPAVGDFDHDNIDDIITFTSDDLGDVWVAINIEIAI